MDSSHTEYAAIPLPAPPESLPVLPNVAEAAPGAERAPSGEQGPAVSNGTPAAAMPVPAAPAPLAGQAMVPAAPAKPGAVSAGMVADDGDLIEKEWVNKAKQIVERNRDDPYKQSEDLTLFKADYMQKRYGKTIKVSR